MHTQVEWVSFRRLGRCQKCNQECAELGKFMSRIYHTLSVNHAGEKMTIEAFTKQLNDGLIKTNLSRKPEDNQLRCKKFWVSI